MRSDHQFTAKRRTPSEIGKDYWQKLKKSTEAGFGKSRATLPQKSFDVLAALNLKKVHEYNLDRSETVIVKNFEEEDEYGNKKIISKSYVSRDRPDSKKLRIKPVLSNSIRYIKSSNTGNSSAHSGQLSVGKVDGTKSAFFKGFIGGTNDGSSQETNKLGDLLKGKRERHHKQSLVTRQESFQENSKLNTSLFMPE